MKQLDAGQQEVGELIGRALREDVGTGDATTTSLVKNDAYCQAVIIAQEQTVVSGTSIASGVFRQVDSKLESRVLIADGQDAVPGDSIMRLSGSAASILIAERTALNFMQRMSGIATLTRAFVDAVSGCDVRILDTRKTTPTLRALEKYAVMCGGGENHRSGLYDRILIKDNHRKLWAASGGDSLAAAVATARETYPDLMVEVEVETFGELEDVLEARPDWILLDNMPPPQMEECVELVAGRCRLEASGGITLENVRDVAASGIDAISLGCLTHSAPAIDYSLEMEL